MAAEARLYISTDANGNLSLGGPWAIAEVKGIADNTTTLVTEAVAQCAVANTRRKSLTLYNNGTSTVYMCSTAADDKTTGFPVAPGAVFTDNVTYGAWWACCDTGLSSNLRGIEVTR